MLKQNQDHDLNHTTVDVSKDSDYSTSIQPPPNPLGRQSTTADEYEMCISLTLSEGELHQTRADVHFLHRPNYITDVTADPLAPTQQPVVSNTNKGTAKVPSNVTKNTSFSARNAERNEKDQVDRPTPIFINVNDTVNFEILDSTIKEIIGDESYVKMWSRILN